MLRPWFYKSGRLYIKEGFVKLVIKKGAAEVRNRLCRVQAFAFIPRRSVITAFKRHNGTPPARLFLSKNA